MRSPRPRLLPRGLDRTSIISDAAESTAFLVTLRLARTCLYPEGKGYDYVCWTNEEKRQEPPYSVLERVNTTGHFNDIELRGCLPTPETGIAIIDCRPLGGS